MEILRLYNNASVKRRFLLFEASAFSDLRSLPALSTHFALFTALDLTAITTPEMYETARILITNGLVYACAWGPDCERWHDVIDHEDIALMQQRDEYQSSSDVVMTTWHDKESLTKALWFFKYCAEPTDSYAKDCHDYIIVTTTNHNAEIRLAFRKA